MATAVYSTYVARFSMGPRYIARYIAPKFPLNTLPANYLIGWGSRAPREGDEWSVVDKTIHPLVRWPTTVGHAQASRGQKGNSKSEQDKSGTGQVIDNEPGACSGACQSSNGC